VAITPVAAAPHARLRELVTLLLGEERRHLPQRVHAELHHLSEQLLDLGLLGLDEGRVTSVQRELAQLGLRLTERAADLLHGGCVALAQGSDLGHLVVGEAEPPLEVLGPALAPLPRLLGRHRLHLLVKAPTVTALRAALSPLDGKEFQAKRRGVDLIVDVDPVSLL